MYWNISSVKNIRQLIKSAMSLMSKALEVKDYCCRVFLDVIQDFDNVGHKGFLAELPEQLPHTRCALLESYLTDHQFRVTHVETVNEWKHISAGVPQGGVLGPILYQLCITD